MKRKILVICLAVLFFLVAAGVTAYPLISNYVNDKYQSVVRTDYAKEIEEMDDSALLEARAAAQAYNDSLSPLRYNKEAVQAASVDYDSLLNLNGSGIMGYVEVPKLSINLPEPARQCWKKASGILREARFPLAAKAVIPS